MKWLGRLYAQGVQDSSITHVPTAAVTEGPVREEGMTSLCVQSVPLVPWVRNTAILLLLSTAQLQECMFPYRTKPTFSTRTKKHILPTKTHL